MVFLKKFSHEAPAESDVAGKGWNHPPDGVMFVTGGDLRSGADGSYVSGTAMPPTAHCLFF